MNRVKLVNMNSNEEHVDGSGYPEVGIQMLGFGPDTGSRWKLQIFSLYSSVLVVLADILVVIHANLACSACCASICLIGSRRGAQNDARLAPKASKYGCKDAPSKRNSALIDGQV